MINALSSPPSPIGFFDSAPPSWIPLWQNHLLPLFLKICGANVQLCVVVVTANGLQLVWPWNAFEDLQDSSIDTFSDVELHKHVGYYSCSELLSFIVRMEINTFFLRTLGKKRSCKC